MPHILTFAPHIPGGNAATMKIDISASPNPGERVPYNPGDLGKVFVADNKQWKMVILDEGSSAIVAGTLLFWKDRAKSIVTNVVADALNGATTNAWRNVVAGFYMGSSFTPTAGAGGHLINVLVAGSGVSVLCSAGAIGTILVADVAANVGQTLGIAAGTAPTFYPLGTVTTAATGSPSKAVAEINVLGTP